MLFAVSFPFRFIDSPRHIAPLKLPVVVPSLSIDSITWIEKMVKWWRRKKTEIMCCEIIIVVVDDYLHISKIVWRISSAIASVLCSIRLFGRRRNRNNNKNRGISLNPSLHPPRVCVLASNARHTMSYTELESGYQGLRQNRPGFYVGHDGNIISFVSCTLYIPFFCFFFYCFATFHSFVR